MEEKCICPRESPGLASIPTSFSQNVAWAIGKLVQEQAKLLKKPVKKRKTPSFITLLEKFKDKCEEIFNIAACKCQDLKSCVCARIYKVCVISIITRIYRKVTQMSHFEQIIKISLIIWQMCLVRKIIRKVKFTVIIFSEIINSLAINRLFVK
jgi:hypothetical protein